MKKIVVMSCIWLSTVATHFALASVESSPSAQHRTASESTDANRPAGFFNGIYTYIAELLGGNE